VSRIDNLLRRENAFDLSSAENGFLHALQHSMWLAFLFAATILASFSLFAEEETN